MLDELDQAIAAAKERKRIRDKIRAEKAIQAAQKAREAAASTFTHDFPLVTKVQAWWQAEDDNVFVLEISPATEHAASVTVQVSRNRAGWQFMSLARPEDMGSAIEDHADTDPDQYGMSFDDALLLYIAARSEDAQVK